MIVQYYFLKAWNTDPKASQHGTIQQLTIAAYILWHNPQLISKIFIIGEMIHI
jgi:hypothetical protein